MNRRPVISRQLRVWKPSNLQPVTDDGWKTLLPSKISACIMLLITVMWFNVLQWFYIVVNSDDTCRLHELQRKEHDGFGCWRFGMSLRRPITYPRILFRVVFFSVPLVHLSEQHCSARQQRRARFDQFFCRSRNWLRYRASGISTVQGQRGIKNPLIW